VASVRGDQSLPLEKPEIDMPNNLTAFSIGKSAFSSSADTDFNLVWLPIVPDQRPAARDLSEVGELHLDPPNALLNRDQAKRQR
jgi:hypothetical protein